METESEFNCIEYLGLYRYKAPIADLERAVLEWISMADTEWFSMSSGEATVCYRYKEPPGYLVRWMDKKFEVADDGEI